MWLRTGKENEFFYADDKGKVLGFVYKGIKGKWRIDIDGMDSINTSKIFDTDTEAFEYATKVINGILNVKDNLYNKNRIH